MRVPMLLAAAVSFAVAVAADAPPAGSGGVTVSSLLGGAHTPEPLWVDAYLDRAPSHMPVLVTIEAESSRIRRSLRIVGLDTPGRPTVRLAHDVRDGTTIGVVGEPKVIADLLGAPAGASIRFRMRRVGPARTFRVDELTVISNAAETPTGR